MTLGVARVIPTVVCAPCATMHFLWWCYSAGIGAIMCHRPLAPEENETEQVFTGDLQHLMGMDPITPKARDTSKVKNSLAGNSFFECCTWCQQIDLSTASSWTNLWKMMHLLQKKVNRRFASLESAEAQISPVECEETDLGLLLERVVKFAGD